MRGEGERGRGASRVRGRVAPVRRGGTWGESNPCEGVAAEGRVAPSFQGRVTPRAAGRDLGKSV